MLKKISHYTRAAILVAAAGTLLAALPAGAIDLGSLKDKAQEVTGVDVDTLTGVGKNLMSAFENNPQAKSAVQSILGNISEGSYNTALTYYDKIRSLKLTPEQLSAWNSAKNELSAIMLNKEFDYENSKLSSIVDRAVTAVKSGDLDAAKSQFASLTKAADLSSEQEDLLSGILDHLPALPLGD